MDRHAPSLPLAHSLSATQSALHVTSALSILCAANEPLKDGNQADSAVDHGSSSDSDVDEDKPFVLTSGAVTGKPTPALTATAQSRASFGDLLCNQTVMLAAGLYTLLGFVTCIYNEVLPIWSINTQEHGGVNFDSADIGKLNIGAGVMVMVWQVRHSGDLAFPCVRARHDVDESTCICAGGCFLDV